MSVRQWLEQQILDRGTALPVNGNQRLCVRIDDPEIRANIRRLDNDGSLQCNTHQQGVDVQAG